MECLCVGRSTNVDGMRTGGLLREGGPGMLVYWTDRLTSTAREPSASYARARVTLVSSISGTAYDHIRQPPEAFLQALLSPAPSPQLARFALVALQKKRTESRSVGAQ